MIKLVPQPQYAGLSDGEKVQLFLSQLTYFEEDGQLAADGQDDTLEEVASEGGRHAAEGAHLWGSEGELVLNAAVIHSPAHDVPVEWIKGRVSAKVALVDAGHGTVGVVFETVEHLVSFLKQTVDADYCKSLMQASLPDLSSGVEEKLRIWIPIPSLHTAFLRLATLSDDLAGCPVRFSDLPSSSADGRPGLPFVLLPRTGLDPRLTHLSIAAPHAGGFTAEADPERAHLARRERTPQMVEEVTGGLPQGWQTVLDPVTQNVYYCNALTGQSQWTRPA
eukprot:GGOE01001426.1.p1 GENE.GGOE01001426.1~~GGOE01001426.1.p1  ORF type:complete len:287 (+),score=69.26 GGOE01001426.1:28-861(+)